MEREPDLAEMRTVIARHRPDLAGAEMQLRSAGADSVAVEVAGQVIFKFPRHVQAAGRLRVEAAVLAALAGRVRLPIPAMRLYPGPPLSSAHAMIPGGHLLAADYAGLDLAARHRLAADLAGFLAELHAMDPAKLRHVGVQEVASWMAPEAIAAAALPRLPEGLHDLARAVLADYAVLPPDPLGLVFGFFDLHGWNMAFDPSRGRLNGIFDFGDSGIGPLHQDFIRTGFISYDLTGRVVEAYGTLTGSALDVGRIATQTGVHRLWELASAGEGPAERATMAENFAAFASATRPV